MAKVRTATTATDRSSTGGICQARVISHAETPANASALPSDSTPSPMAASTRGSRGRNRPAAGSRWRRPAAPGFAAPGFAALAIAARGSDGRIAQPFVEPLGDHLDDRVTDRHDPLAVADEHHRRTGACALDDGAQHPILGMG